MEEAAGRQSGCIELGFTWVISFLILATALLSGCATADLTLDYVDSGAASLELNLMASSQNSTQCMVVAIDGNDVSDQQSFRLTEKYLLPSGQHKLALLCEDYVGSIPLSAYRFAINVYLEDGGSYLLVKRMRRSASPCIAIEEAGGADKSLSVAEYCLEESDIDG